MTQRKSLSSECHKKSWVHFEQVAPYADHSAAGLYMDSRTVRKVEKGPYRVMGTKWADLRVRSSSWVCLTRNQPAPAGSVA